jgi:hypothetical protein
MRLVTFSTVYAPFNAGESGLVPDSLAERLVAQGVASIPSGAGLHGYASWAATPALGAQLLRDYRAGSAEAMRLQREGGFQHSQ